MTETPLVVLVGPPAAGKTRVGKRLAKAFGTAFIDTDALVVDQWGPIPLIFDEQGEDFFREKERLAVTQALQSEGIVALGGGAVVNPDTRAELQAHRVAVISISPEAVVHRLDNTKRPLLKGGMDAWTKLVESRAEFYAEVATRTFDASHQSVDSLAEEIAQWLREDS